MNQDTFTLPLTPPTTTAASAFTRVWNVVRLHVVNWMTLIVVPLMILGFIFLVNWVIWWILSVALPAGDHGNATEGMAFSGASAFIFVYQMVIAIMAINLTFAFAQGYSVTRRDFYLGSVLAFVLLSAGWAAVLTVLAELESLTNGWFVGGAMFDVIYFGEGPAQHFVTAFTLMLFFYFLGSAFASVYVRWRANGMLVFCAVLVIALVAFLAWVTLDARWPEVLAWFVETGPVGVVMWTLVPTALSAVVGFALLRGATPRD